MWCTCATTTTFCQHTLFVFHVVVTVNRDFFVPKTALTDLSFRWVSSAVCVVQTFFGLQTGCVLAASISIVCSFCVSVSVCM